MRAKVTQAFPGRRDHEAVTSQILEGEIITGDLARVAIGEKWADLLPDEDPADAAPEAPEAKPNLSKLKVDELRTYAADRQIDLGVATTKAEIIAAIEKAEAAE